MAGWFDGIRRLILMDTRVGPILYAKRNPGSAIEEPRLYLVKTLMLSKRLAFTMMYEPLLSVKTLLLSSSLAFTYFASMAMIQSYCLWALGTEMKHGPWFGSAEYPGGGG